LSPEDKLLFIYLWTNKHCNQAGLYEITLKTIAFDTGLPLEISFRTPIANWSRKSPGIQSKNLIWVKNFLKRQCKSQSFLIAAVKCLKAMRTNSLVMKFINYNQSLNLEPLYKDNGG